ncbi:hypothetical protein MAPG_09257 [Magnaporthiopsis poae ATCC 64411]|uniref:Uncharacterized protein n=1 Tax=Magnaporthiopsis poae (strain ATCC 64411 / 73-15) TaxID=644358 RepID=A0A0C4E9H2_MAGP6|nr:hypothetical protein MAPG_09257 [Magnaporthiopsis poae ATCC 64411]
MVGVVTGLAVAVAPVLGAVGAGTATSAAVAASGAAALEGAGVGATVVALGEGACVGVGAIGGGSSAGIAFASLLGPIGWAIVGCDENDDQNGDGGYTWDCWKPVVRDTSTQPSCGMSLRCLAAHPNVESMSLDQGGLLVGNVFGERFRLTPVSVEGTLAFHASIL